MTDLKPPLWQSQVMLCQIKKIKKFRRGSRYAFMNVPKVTAPVSYHSRSVRYMSQSAAWASGWCVCPLWSLCGPYSYCTVPPRHWGSSDCNSGTRWETASRCRKNNRKEIIENKTENPFIFSMITVITSGEMQQCYWIFSSKLGGNVRKACYLF